MTDIDKAALLAELVALSSVEHQQPGDITVRDFEIAAGVCYSTACRLLAEQVAAGVLTKHRVLLDTGHMGAVYRPTKAAG